MLVGKTVGPFAIDRELGTGAMGAVYRARYLKTGQLVAFKIMAPGLDLTNPNAAARFEREIKILRQFNHPNIVRMFGAGTSKSQGIRYLAMEYVEGESLDHVMSRRGRMSWEEVIALGQQLCAALQHAHEQGVVHRDLKPSNLMILKDGTLKLTDFGIAKDLDVTRLTSDNCTVGTAAYMSPEQCRGDIDLTYKSDLYSLGVVLYELATGRKPFEAENAMDMFMKHVQGEFTRPSKVVLDMPIWLDTLICQLLEKKTDHRPFDAATVFAALGKVQERAEAQHSAGVEAAKMRVIDRAPGSRPVDETDREMARTLLTGKHRGKRRRKREMFYQRGWFVIAGLLALFGALGFTLFLLFGPPPPEKLYAQAKVLMESSDHEDHTKAAEGPIKQFLARFADRPGEQTEQMKRWSDDAAVEQCEDLIARYRQKKGARLSFEAQDKTQEMAFKAVDEEEDGALPEAREKWKAIQKEHGKEMWGVTAARRLAMLDAVDNKDKDWQQVLEQMKFNGQEVELSSPEKEAFIAYRAEHLRQGEGKPDKADWPLVHDTYKAIHSGAKDDPSKHFWSVLAAKKIHESEARARDVKEPEQERKELVSSVIEAAKSYDVTSTQARSIAMDVIAIYGNAEKYPYLTDLVTEAKKKIVDKANEYQGNR
jgi:eukaryotic-like serine/threonine-protein kinase